jgi:hypothetical protein
LKSAVTTAEMATPGLALPKCIRLNPPNELGLRTPSSGSKSEPNCSSVPRHIPTYPLMDYRQGGAGQGQLRGNLRPVLQATYEGPGRDLKGHYDLVTGVQPQAIELVP